MKYTLAILLLIVVNVESQVEQCVCTMPRALISTYVTFNRRAFPNIEWDSGMSSRAKEELTHPGRYTHGRPELAFVTGSGLVPKGYSIYDQVRKVLGSQFIRKLSKLRPSAPSKFGCNGELADYNDHQRNLTIGCLYRLTVNNRNSAQDI